MILNKKLLDLKECIYSVIRKIIKDKYPKKVLYFELGWDKLWDSICQLKDKDPHKWKIEDLRQTSSSVFSYPSEDANREVKAITLTATAIGTDLIGAKRNLSAEEKAEIVRAYIEQFSPPEYVHQDIFSAFIKTGGEAIAEPIEEKPSAKTPEEEKKEYIIYSHENQQKPYPASKEEVEKLRKLNPKKMSKRFVIYFDDEMGQIVVNGQVKRFVGKEGKEKLRLKRLLYQFLINVGKRVSYSQIKIKVMEEYKKDEEVTDSAVQQLKNRLCIFTEQEIAPFIEPCTDVEIGDKGYFIKEENNGIKFRYCLIIRSGK
ncbi:MAG: hypothetical protein PVH61_37185 [Candidatus Aminicenantes bacterium]|jgi:hypothetical protein